MQGKDLEGIIVDGTAHLIDNGRDVLTEVRPVGTAAMHLDVIHRGGE